MKREVVEKPIIQKKLTLEQGCTMPCSVKTRAALYNLKLYPFLQKKASLHGFANTSWMLKEKVQPEL